MRWSDVTPPNWDLALQNPYVFGQAVAAVCREAPRGVRVTSRILSAVTEDPDGCRTAAEKAVAEFSLHQERFRALGKMLIQMADSVHD